MRMNKRLVALFMATVMVLALTACAKTNNTTPTGSNQQADQGQTQDADNGNGGTGVNASADQMVVPAKLTGKLNLIEMDDRDPSVLRGVRIVGLSVGTGDGFNGRDSSLDDVRCIFELNEWVEFYPDIDKEYGLRVWILEHRDDHEFYKTCDFADVMPGFAGYCDLHYPVDEEDPDSWCWGSFYLNPDDHGAGYYDFVFTYDGKAIATLVTRFYNENENELSTMSDDELEALMRE